LHALRKNTRKTGSKTPNYGQDTLTDQRSRPNKHAKTPVKAHSQPRPTAKKTAAKKAKKAPLQRRAYSMNPDSQYLTRSEIDRLFDVIKSPRDRAIFRLVYHRGLRSSEPGLLQLSDWNERDGLLHIRRGKNSWSRDYRLGPKETRALRAWLKIRGHEHGPLFPSSHGTRPGGFGIHRNRLDQLFRAYCAEAGIRPEKAHMHVLKHSCGTHMAENNNSAEVIQDWLGHRAATSTAIYMHFSQRRRDEAYEKNKDWC
jgi:integrase